MTLSSGDKVLVVNGVALGKVCPPLSTEDRALLVPLANGTLAAVHVVAPTSSGDACLGIPVAGHSIAVKPYVKSDPCTNCEDGETQDTYYISWSTQPSSIVTFGDCVELETGIYSESYFAPGDIVDESYFLGAGGLYSISEHPCHRRSTSGAWACEWIDEPGEYEECEVAYHQYDPQYDKICNYIGGAFWLRLCSGPSCGSLTVIFEYECPWYAWRIVRGADRFYVYNVGPGIGTTPTTTFYAEVETDDCDDLAGSVIQNQITGPGYISLADTSMILPIGIGGSIIVT